MIKFLRKHAGLMAVLVLVIGLFAFARFSGMVHAVATGSMEPTLPVHTIVVDHPVDTLKVGDVITFQEAGMTNPVTHRLIQINKDGSLVTQGDANPTPDHPDVPLHKSDVLGQVWFQIQVMVPSFWTTIPGIILAVSLLLIIVLYVTKADKKDEEDEAQQSDKSREESLEPTPV